MDSPNADAIDLGGKTILMRPVQKQPPTDWQPIATAPKDGTDVLLFLPTYKRQVWLGHYSVRETFSHGKLEHRYEEWSLGLAYCTDKPEPTHWMPVPAGPDLVERA